MVNCYLCHKPVKVSTEKHLYDEKLKKRYHLRCFAGICDHCDKPIKKGSEKAIGKLTFHKKCLEQHRAVARESRSMMAFSKPRKNASLMVKCVECGKEIKWSDAMKAEGKSPLCDPCYKQLIGWKKNPSDVEDNLRILKQRFGRIYPTLKIWYDEAKGLYHADSRDLHHEAMSALGLDRMLSDLTGERGNPSGERWLTDGELVNPEELRENFLPLLAAPAIFKAGGDFIKGTGEAIDKYVKPASLTAVQMGSRAMVGAGQAVGKAAEDEAAKAKPVANPPKCAGCHQQITMQEAQTACVIDGKGMYHIRCYPDERLLAERTAQRASEKRIQAEQTIPAKRRGLLTRENPRKKLDIHDAERKLDVSGDRSYYLVATDGRVVARGIGSPTEAQAHRLRMQQEGVESKVVYPDELLSEARTAKEMLR